MQKPVTYKTTQLVIDRIEAGHAVVEAGSTTLDLPLDLLPAGATDGAFLVMTVAVDEAAREEASRRVRELQERLGG